MDFDHQYGTTSRSAGIKSGWEKSHYGESSSNNEWISMQLGQKIQRDQRWWRGNADLHVVRRSFFYYHETWLSDTCIYLRDHHQKKILCWVWKHKGQVMKEDVCVSFPDKWRSCLHWILSWVWLRTYDQYIQRGFGE